MALSELDKQLHAEWYRDPDAYVDLRRSRTGRVLWEYAQALRAAGDLRGDLIVLDFGTSEEPARVEQRARLLAQWLGSRFANRRNVETSSGLLSVIVDEQDPELLSDIKVSPGAAYLQMIEIRGRRPHLERVLEVLASMENDWLGILGLRQTEPSARELDAQLLRSAFARCPSLDLVAIDGIGVVSDLVHTTPRIVEVRGHRAMAAVTQGGPVHSTIRCMRLELFSGLESEETLPVCPLLPRTAFPSVEVLELHPGRPRSPIDASAIFHALPRIDVLPRLVHLEIPHPGSDSERDILESVLARMPLLEQLDLTGSGSARHRPTHPKVRIRCTGPAAAFSLD